MVAAPCQNLCPCNMDDCCNQMAHELPILRTNAVALLREDTEGQTPFPSRPPWCFCSWVSAVSCSVAVADRGNGAGPECHNCIRYPYTFVKAGVSHNPLPDRSSLLSVVLSFIVVGLPTGLLPQTSTPKRHLPSPHTSAPRGLDSAHR